MRERAVLFGRDLSLIGVLTKNERRDSPGKQSPTGVVILSAGLDHHVGPNRIYVKLARRLAEMGFVVFRFSFSGIGDSGPRRDKRPADESMIDETQQAMNWLADQAGVERFVAVGLCNGAGAAFRIATLDRRVRGAVLINPPPPETSRDELMGRSYYWDRALFSTRSWKKLFLGKSAYREILRLTGLKLKNRLRPDYAQNSANAEIIEELTRSFRFIQEQKTQMVIIGTDDVTGYNYLWEFMRKEYTALKNSGLLSRRTLNGTDHVVTTLAGQESLLTLISEWMVKKFGGMCLLTLLSVLKTGLEV